LIASNRIFEQMSLSALESADKIVNWFNTTEKLNYVPQYVCLRVSSIAQRDVRFRRIQKFWI
jgi:hypothetical protein